MVRSVCFSRWISAAPPQFLLEEALAWAVLYLWRAQLSARGRHRHAQQKTGLGQVPSAPRAKLSARQSVKELQRRCSKVSRIGQVLLRSLYQLCWQSSSVVDRINVVVGWPRRASGRLLLQEIAVILRANAGIRRGIRSFNVVQRSFSNRCRSIE